ncbi:MAG: transketolase [Candidatus Fischerbacteria bacterium RBG_13_37_8]|uniref:Transketolase n=1 Tax=Candidatus Fischerbacteria bacterium RBG_13_37_8 TaxID=1817863 RepID=A0A1F5VTF9_9BACT|nr:MAG: transketolase [Candidatus Fischerbacteria bacterium RBG_13_37_8]
MNKFKHRLTKDKLEKLKELARLCRGDILKMTTIAGSGHPGGSMSSIEIFLALYSFANISPQNYDDEKRDRIIVSHGHTSPGVYSCLARLGFINLEEVLLGFRKVHSPFEGHIERQIPGVEWTTGNLGQGLSAGCGFALASKIKELPYHTFVVMSDAEQAKGQVAEARRFAHKYNLCNLTALIDYNQYQISGRIEKVMPVNIVENYLADGWKTLTVDGHNFLKIYEAIGKAISDSSTPYVIICKTVIGKGVKFMENCEKYPEEDLSQAEYHGKALNREKCAEALKILELEDDIDSLIKKKETLQIEPLVRKEISLPILNTGKPVIYSETIDPRTVFGNALVQVALENTEGSIAVFDCDLAESVQTFLFHQKWPKYFFEAGVSEHSTATIAGAVSINGVVTIWADFGVFAIDEVYNQLRLNDINSTNLKIIATHLGYNVGPDGKTHHCIDYIGLLRNLYGFKLIIPADPNQTDHAVRYILNKPGNYVIGMGRTKLPIIITNDNRIFFNDTYRFDYGKVDLLREGNDCAIFALGAMVSRAIEAYNILQIDNIHPCVYCVSSPMLIKKEIIEDAGKTGLIITYEDHNIHSGLGNEIAQIIAENNLHTKLIKIGISGYGKSDETQILYRKYALDAESTAALIKKSL